VIITREQLKEVTGYDYYNEDIIQTKIAYKFFKDKVYPLGNIVSFTAPATQFSNMVHFCIELPTTSIWGGVVFQRLYNTIIAEMLSELVGSSVEVEDGELFIRKEFTSQGVIISRGKVSISSITERQRNVLIHIGISILANKNAPVYTYSTNINDDQIKRLQSQCIEAFYHTVLSIFISTTRIG